MSPATTHLVPVDLCSDIVFQGVVRVELVEFTRLMQVKIRPCGEQGSIQERQRLSMMQEYYPPEVTKLSFSLCFSVIPKHDQNISRVLFFFKKDFNVGPGWLSLTEPLAVGQLYRAKSQGVVRVELLEFTS